MLPLVSRKPEESETKIQFSSRENSESQRMI